MSDRAQETLACPTCGQANPTFARYCHNCGARLPSVPTTATPPDATADFGEAVADVVSEAPVEQVEPGTQSEADRNSTVAQDAPEVLATPVDASSITTATAPPLPVVAQAPPTPRSNRTLWIILGIFAIIVLCCCVLALLVAITAANDSAFHEDVSGLAALFHT